MIKAGKIKLLFGVLLLWFFSGHCFAQLDSSYFEKNEYKLMIYGLLYENYLGLSCSEANGENRVDYVPNSSANFGLGILHEKIPFKIMFAYNLGIKDTDNDLETKSFDFQIHKYGRMYVADIFIQRYTGFYIDELQSDKEKANCPDLLAMQQSIVGQYVFNGKRFSYQAAFNQNETQLKSAGSIIGGIELSHFRINSDSSFVFRKQNDFQSFQIGVNSGYAYNWVINKYWLFCGSINIGANISNKRVKTFFNQDIYVSPTLLLRISCFYNNENWSLGLSAVLKGTSFINKDKSELEFYSGRLGITYVQRFK